MKPFIQFATVVMALSVFSQAPATDTPAPCVGLTGNTVMCSQCPGLIPCAITAGICPSVQQNCLVLDEVEGGGPFELIDAIVPCWSFQDCQARNPLLPPHPDSNPCIRVGEKVTEEELQSIPFASFCGQA